MSVEPEFQELLNEQERVTGLILQFRRDCGTMYGELEEQEFACFEQGNEQCVAQHDSVKLQGLELKRKAAVENRKIKVLCLQGIPRALQPADLSAWAVQTPAQLEAFKRFNHCAMDCLGEVLKHTKGEYDLLRSASARLRGFLV